MLLILIENTLILAQYIKDNKRSSLILASFILLLGIGLIFPRSITHADEFFFGLEQEDQFVNTFPISERRARYSMKIPVSAYNSVPGQTDSTPCIAARGYDLCAANEENVIAANFVPIGTKVKFPEIFGNKEFTVVDRMNARYKYRADLWMKQISDARKFGVKYTTIEVY